MKKSPTKLPNVTLLTPTLFKDDRGLFFESYQEKTFQELGITDTFTQDNHSISKQGTLRGLHYQIPPHAQSKLIRCTQGEIFDVAIDIRKNSPTFGQWTSHILNDQNHNMLYIPEGFAHGLYVLSETATVLYKCNAPYNPKSERSLIWNDLDININWPLINDTPLLSQKDAIAPLLKDQKDLF